jgi:hypothetical protein
MADNFLRETDGWTPLFAGVGRLVRFRANRGRNFVRRLDKRMGWTVGLGGNARYTLIFHRARPFAVINSHAQTLVTTTSSNLTSPVDLAHASTPTSPTAARPTTWRGRLAIAIVIASLIATVFWAAFLTAVVGYVIASLL